MKKRWIMSILWFWNKNSYAINLCCTEAVSVLTANPLDTAWALGRVEVSLLSAYELKQILDMD